MAHNNACKRAEGWQRPSFTAQYSPRFQSTSTLLPAIRVRSELALKGVKGPKSGQYVGRGQD